jgi:hypothetical protein
MQAVGRLQVISDVSRQRLLVGARQPTQLAESAAALAFPLQSVI